MAITKNAPLNKRGANLNYNPMSIQALVSTVPKNIKGTKGYSSLLPDIFK